MRFFFYGTLIAGSGNAVAKAVHLHLRDLGSATVRGRLYAIHDPQGWYPALLPGEREVVGRLYEAAEGFGPRTLAELDGWEDCDPADPVGSLYARMSVDVIAADGSSVEAHAYRYNQPLPDGAVEIASGDFADFLSAGGHRAFCG